MSCRIPTMTIPRLDLRNLEPPEPMRHALEAVEALRPGGLVEIVTDREPMLLQRELDRRGYRYVCTAVDGGYQTVIRRTAAADMKP